MAINQNFNGASLFHPGAYSKTVVNLSGGFPLAATGIVALVGEALNGAPGSSDGVQTFTSEDIAALIAKYGSGSIVDAARILIAPARDNRVPNGASLIRVYKTNASTQATLSLKNAAPVNLFTITSANWGADQNLISVKVEAGTNVNARIITVQKGDTKEVLPENAYDAMLSIQYIGAGTAATLLIQNNTLTTTVTGAATDNQNILLTGKTLSQVVELIANFNGGLSYTCTTTYKLASSKSAADLDSISTALDILTTAKTLRAQQKELLDIINGQSALITATRVANVEGTIAALVKTFLTGGATGASTNSNFQSAFDALLAARINTVVTLVSRNASALITEGLTDPSSTFTVDAINTQAVTHCILASNTKNRSERNTYVSKKDSFANTQAAALDLNHERASMLFQDVEVLGTDGNLKFLDPWAAACMIAGIQAGTDVGTPATFKLVAANSIKHQDYNAKTQSDLAIAGGLLALEEPDSGGIRVVVQNSTYGKDANFVFNRPSVLYAADVVAFNLRQQLEAIYVGEKAKSGSALAIKNTVIAIMQQFLDADITVGDDTNSGLGWKDLTVTLLGNTAKVNITITPVQGIDFILNTITLDNIKQSA